MESENSLELHFYQSKIRNILLIIMEFLFIALGVVVCGAAFKTGDFFVSGAGALLVLFFSFMIVVIVKGMLGSKPYLILTEEVLITSALSKNAIPIQWDDIKGYNIRHVNFNRFIEIILYDEEKYRARMSNTMRRLNKVNKIVDSTLFAIVWGQVKRKDRRKLVHQLDSLHNGDFELSKELYPHMGADKKEQKTNSRVNRTYIVQAYAHSLILTGLASPIFYSATGEDNNITFLVISLLFYPFARFIYDSLIGFKLDDKMIKQSDTVQSIYRLRILIHPFLYLFSFYIGPFGILYLMLRPFFRFIKRSKS